MGIDIYCKWEGQTEEDKQAQYTGFSVVAGRAGYLREAYHGGPYVTKFLVREAFDGGEAQIPASVLRERLPAAVLLAMFRNQKIYAKEPHPENINLEVDKDLEALKVGLEKIFTNEMVDATHEQIAREFTPATLQTGKDLIEGGILPDYAKSFVEFVELCERKEKELGEPCTIIASY
jgi:hypothetical protein